MIRLIGNQVLNLIFLKPTLKKAVDFQFDFLPEHLLHNPIVIWDYSNTGLVAKTANLIMEWNNRLWDEGLALDFGAIILPQEMII